MDLESRWTLQKSGLEMEYYDTKVVKCMFCERTFEVEDSEYLYTLCESCKGYASVERIA